MNQAEKIKAAQEATVFVVMGYFVNPDGQTGSGLRLPVTPGRTDFGPDTFGYALLHGNVEELRKKLAFCTLDDGAVLKPRDANVILKEWRELMGLATPNT